MRRCLVLAWCSEGKALQAKVLQGIFCRGRAVGVCLGWAGRGGECLGMVRQSWLGGSWFGYAWPVKQRSGMADKAAQGERGHVMCFVRSGRAVMASVGK